MLLPVSSVYITTQLSIFLQFFTGIFNFIGILYKLPQPDKILVDVLQLESLVQALQFVFYISFVNKFNLETLAVTRYGDWFITTPVMLFTTIVYLAYEARMQENDRTGLYLYNFLVDNKNDVIQIFIGNFFMLLTGLFGELGYISKTTSLLLGFLAFAYTFNIIYKNYAKFSENGKKLFNIFALIWSLYGLGYILPVIEKNVLFNILDIISKNFFGVYLYLLVDKLSKEYKITSN